MNRAIMLFFRTARKGESEELTDRERALYLDFLENLMNEVPVLSNRDVQDIFSFIERSVRFYLTVCARRKRKRNTYEGCMENLLFLTDYLMHYYSAKISKNNLLRLYDLAVHIERLKPLDTAEVLRYEIETGLPEKIHFLIEYYYP